MKGTRLVKTGQRTVELVNYGPVTRVEREYAVLVDGALRGAVSQRWGIESGYVRSRVASYWMAYDIDGEVIGYRDLREDAVALIVNRRFGS